MPKGMFLDVTVRDPESMLYEGRCSFVSAINPQGEFDVLPQHTGFITLISERLTLGVYKGAELEIEFESGVLRCASDVVSVYLGLESVTIE